MLITIHSSHWRKKKREREPKERSLPEAPHGHSLADTISEDNLTCEKIAARVLSCNCYGALSQQPTNQNRKGTSPFLRAALSLKPGSKPWGGNVATAQQLEKWFCSREQNMSPHDHARSRLKGKQGLHGLPCLQSNYLMVRAFLPASKTGQNSPKKKPLPSLGLNNISTTRAIFASESHQKVVFLYPLLLIFTSRPNHTRGLTITSYGTWNKARDEPGTKQPDLPSYLWLLKAKEMASNHGISTALSLVSSVGSTCMPVLITNVGMVRTISTGWETG